MQQIRGPQSQVRLLLAIPICAWAISWPVMKVGVDAVTPIWFGCFRYFVAASCLAFIGIIRGGLSIPTRQDWGLVLVSGGLQMAAFSALTATALTVIPPGRASVLAYSTPLWVVPLAAWRLNEPPSRKALLGVVAGLIGIAIIAAPSFHAGRAEQLVGYAMLVAAAALWGICIVYVRTHRFHATALELAPWQMLLASLLLLPLAILTDGSFPVIGIKGALALAYVGPFATALAYWAIVEAGRQLPASVISMALLTTPVLGTMVSALSFGEVVDDNLIGGMLLIGFGIYLATVETRSGVSAQARR